VTTGVLQGTKLVFVIHSVVVYVMVGMTVVETDTGCVLVLEALRVVLLGIVPFLECDEAVEDTLEFVLEWYGVVMEYAGVVV